MILSLTDLSSEPLQGQIARQIRAKILAGNLPSGESLPSIRRLAREQHISVITVQRAYEFLERDGLIHSRRGKGFFVSDLPEDKKKAMAHEKLQENLKSPVYEALEEGLAEDDIRSAVADLLKKMKPQRR